jgi:mRNA-degrading endonuclease YafQ of YafQ-DinJ toxin-antitoxin module
MEISLVPQFRRQFKKLPEALKKEAREKIELFKDPQMHSLLHIHKLHGRLADRWSFSVNYKFRIIFAWEKQNESAVLIAIGGHALYD